jgi:cyclopropane-fatty-acyl-phospholipid synthase
VAGALIDASESRAGLLGAQAGVAAAVRGALSQLAGGRLERLPFTLRFWDGSVLPATSDGAGGTEASRAPTVVVRDPAAVAHILRAPNQVGLARAWVSGLLETDDLEAVLRLRARWSDLRLTAGDRAKALLTALRVGGVRVARRPPVPAIEAQSAGRRHSIARDRMSVRHHYDVSNRFYGLVLGPTMVYSCAYFGSPDESLEAAQERKLDLLCRKLRLRAGERLLDIGCGWGSLVIHAAARYGARAVGVTLSERQAGFARERAAQAGAEDRVSVRVADYREVLDGPYDKIVSVGMYEHVGRAELGGYVRKARRLLRPGGLFLNHGIARLHSRAPDGETFISRYIFPDGELHPVGDLICELQACGFETRDVESLREHYPLTLRRWLSNLESHRDEVIAEVGAERERAWRLYMLASAEAFEAGEIGVYQVLAARDGAPHGLPLQRRELIAAS